MRGPTVLLVDDDRAVRACVRDMLEMAGLAVLEAADAPAALAVAAARRQAIDVLLTDVLMPGLDGTELARRVQRLRPRIGILYMSGSSEGALAERGLRCAEGPLLGKPFSEAELLARLRAIVGPAALAGGRPTGRRRRERRPRHEPPAGPPGSGAPRPIRPPA